MYFEYRHIFKVTTFLFETVVSYITYWTLFSAFGIPIEM